MRVMRKVTPSHALDDTGEEAAPFLRPEDIKHYVCVYEFLENRLRRLVGGGRRGGRRRGGGVTSLSDTKTTDP